MRVLKEFIAVKLFKEYFKISGSFLQAKKQEMAFKYLDTCKRVN